MSACRRSTITRPVVVLALIAAFATAGALPVRGDSARKVAAKGSKLDRNLQEAKKKPSDTVRVIVRTARGKADTVEKKLKEKGRQKLADLASIGAIVAHVSGSDLAELENDPDVLGVSTDAVVSSFGATLEEAAASAATLDEVLGTDTSGLTGRKVGIAIVDSGLARGKDLSGGRTDRFVDFTSRGADEAFDDYGHGTHVAGLIGGTGGQSRVRRGRRERNGAIKIKDVPVYAGVAPDARIMSFKVLDENGAGYTSQVIEAIEYIVSRKDALKIDIINLSLGHPILEPATTDPLVLAVERATQAGLIVVAAAGNYGRNPETGLVGYAGITSPGNAPSAITVGAYDSHNTVARWDDTIPEYSSRGPTWYDAYAKPDIVAPGSGLVSNAAPESMLFRTYPGRQVKDRDDKPSYFRLSGTSMATAVASGAVALIVEAARDAHKSDLTPNTIKAILQYTALPLPDYDVLTQGTGAINVAGAVELATKIDLSVPVGQYWLSDALSGATTFDGVVYTWAQRLIWGSRVIWGNTLDINQSTWGQRVIWGSTSSRTLIQGTRVIWGSNVVWDEPATWASSIVWGNTAIGVTNGARVIWGSSDGLTQGTAVWSELVNSD